MALSILKIFTEKNIFEHLVDGHPYHPSESAFLFLKQGKLKMKEQINDLELIPNSIILIDPRTVYEILEYSDDLEIFILSYNRDFVENLFLKFNKLNAYKTIRTEFRKVYQASEGEFNTFWRNIKNIDFYLNQEHTNDYDFEVVESLFTAMVYQMANLIAKNKSISKEKMTRSHEIVLDFIKLLSDNYLKEKNVDFYAQKLMLSTRHLSTVLKEVTGKSANQIINEFIFNEAKALLSSTLKPINKIANHLKFSDQFAFSHFFKKHQNMSPSDYRSLF